MWALQPKEPSIWNKDPMPESDQFQERPGNRQGEDTGMVGHCSASACHPGSFLQLLTCSQVQPGAAHLLLLGQSAPSLLPG